MIKIVFRVLALILRAVAVLLIGVVSAIIGFIVIVNLGFIYAPGFTYNGWQGYEATGPIGFLLGALIGLIGSGALLFRRRSGK